MRVVSVSLSGLVLSDRDQPLRGVTVTAINLFDYAEKSATSDEFGSYRIDGLSAGEYHVCAESFVHSTKCGSPITYIRIRSSSSICILDSGSILASWGTASTRPGEGIRDSQPRPLTIDTQALSAANTGGKYRGLLSLRAGAFLRNSRIASVSLGQTENEAVADLRVWEL